MRNALLWVITQRVVIISYRRFGTTYRSHLKGSIPPCKWDRYVVPKRRQETTTAVRVMTQKSEILKLHRGQTMWDLRRTSSTGKGVSPTTLVLPYQYHSIGHPFAHLQLHSYI